MKKKLKFIPKYSVDYGIKEIITAMKKNKYLKLKYSDDFFGNYKIKKQSL
jgi:hypothetical protein